MAKQGMENFGSYRGKLGNTYGRKVHGVALNALMPTPRGNKNATEEMRDIQLRFKTLAQMASAFMSSIVIGLKARAKAIGPLVSPFDAFIKDNWSATHAEGGVVEIDYGKIQIADGKLPEVGFGSANFEEPLRVSVGFTPNSDTPGADASDKVRLVVYQPDSNKTVMSAPVLRSAGTVEMALPSTWSGMTVHVYGFTVGAGTTNKGIVSDGSYIGTGIVG